jgi:hypothetical protein
MRMLFRHLVIAALPLACGVAASYGFAHMQGSCGALVGPLFASKCHGRQLEYQLLAQTAGTALGTLLAAFLGSWLEQRRRRVVQPQDPNGGDS